MWPNLVEFHSASSEIRRRKKEERKKESVVKRKSADRYVGRPKNTAKFTVFGKLSVKEQ